MSLTALWSRLIGAHSESESQEERLTYDQLRQQAPSVREILERKGAKYDDSFRDFQGYIKEAEANFPSGLIGLGHVPLAGNVHLAVGRIARRQQIEEALNDERCWRQPRVRGGN